MSGGPSDTDFGTGVDLSGLPCVVTGDHGYGMDGKPVVATRASADAGSGTESAYWELPGFYLIVSSDTGHGQEGDTESAAGSDVGTGSESSFMAGFPADYDLSFLSDYSYDINITVLALGDQDSGSGDDSIWATSAPMSDIDSGTGSDAFSVTLPVADVDVGIGAEQLAYVLEIFPYPPAWLFSEPSGAFQLTWLPVGRSERRAVAEIIDRMNDADSLSLVSDTDAGGGLESSLPTATIEQFAVAPSVTCVNASEAELVLLSGASS